MGIPTLHIIYNIEIHKVLKNGIKNRIYTIILKRRSCRIQIYPQKLVLTYLKYQKKGAKPENIAENDPK